MHSNLSETSLVPLPSLQVAMVAGEASGDLLAAQVILALKQQWPHINASGIGGPQMTAQGFKAEWPSEKLSVFGYWDALKVYRSLLKIRNQLANQCLANPPDLFMGVDAPDFNFGLEKKLKQAGIKTIHVVCPSIWAWRPNRVHELKKVADHVLCLFPFEPALLKPHGIEATFIGHPLASKVDLHPNKNKARLALGLANDAQIVAVLPGSRQSEINLIGPIFLQAVALLHQKRPNLQFILPCAPGRRASIEQQLKALGLENIVQLFDGQSHTVLAACDAVMVASGTATLEAALFKCPMVIAYKLGRISYTLMKRMKLQPWVGLPNILSQDFIVPELIQDQATPIAVANEIEKWLDHPDAVSQLKDKLLHLHQSLQQDSSSLVIEAVQKVLKYPQQNS